MSGTVDRGVRIGYSLWDEIKARGIPYDHHESDLYIPVTAETTALVRQYDRNHTAERFISQTDGKPWYDIPFAYLPWWEKRTGRRNPGQKRKESPLTLDELMRIASREYPGDLIWRYHGQPDRNFGDTLAKFISLELADTFSPRASDIEQLVAAAEALEKAKKDIGRVWGALDEEIERRGGG